jgi:hypothetical protein
MTVNDTATYRVRKKPISNTEIAFGITEVYRMANGSAGWVETWMAPVAVCPPGDPLADVKAVAELRRQLMGMIEALNEPIMTEDDDTAERPAPGSTEGRQPEDSH